ncbi:hypothetical protein MTO96_050045 [Rhipicephalus appendiculatus]
MHLSSVNWEALQSDHRLTTLDDGTTVAVGHQRAPATLSGGERPYSKKEPTFGPNSDDYTSRKIYAPLQQQGWRRRL